MDIPSRLHQILNTIPPGVKLIAVSKTHPVSVLKQAYDAGQRRFGENKAQELLFKHSQMPPDTEWHFIGHLQTNKVKQIVPYVHLIHSVDSVKLLAEINRQAEKINRVIPCLLQFYIATEETKYGFSWDEAREFFESQAFLSFRNVLIRGVMGMASLTSDQNLIRSEFRKLNAYYLDLRHQYFAQDPNFCEVSMGMSDDYPIAVAEGSTMIRVGSALFGARNYPIQN